MFCFDCSLSLPDMLRKIVLVAAGIGCAFTLLIGQPTIDISNASANNGETVTITLSVDDYTDYISLECSITWDPDVLLYQGVDNLTTGLPGFTESSSINLQANGLLNVVWFESNITPTTLPDGTTLFEIIFEVTGDPCDSTGINIPNIEIADEDEEVAATVVNPGYVTVPGTGCGTFDGVRIIGQMKTVGPGEGVCIQFITEGFDNIVAASYAIEFNPAVLEYTGIQNVNWPDFAPGTTYNDADADQGILKVVWSDPGTVGIDIPDGTVLYELCFTAIGSGGQMSTIDFTESGTTTIEFADGNSNIVDFQGVPGKVTIEGELEGFALIFPDDSATIGSEICLPVTVNDFIDIIAVGGSINWDSTILKFVRFEGFHPDLPGLDDNVQGPGLGVPGLKANQAVITWSHPSLQEVTLANGSEMMRICFEVIGACDQVSPVVFSDDPLDLEFATLDAEITDYTLVDGSVTVDCGTKCGILNVDIDHICAGGEVGMIDLTMASGCSGVTYEWWPTGANTQDIVGGPGKYVVTITDGGSFIIPDTFEILLLDPIQVSANITDDSGAGDGAIQLTVTGGEEGTYTFLWSNSDMTQNITNLAAGQYTVTITDGSGCTFVGGPYTVTGPGMGVNASITHVDCFGASTGCIDITSVTCVSNPTSYQWSSSTVTGPQLCDIPAGTYSVTVTGDGGATCTASFQVQQASSAIQIAIDTMNETSAENDGEIHLSVSGGQGPYTYAWSHNAGLTGPDATGLQGGEYIVTVTDQFGCEVVRTILIRGNELFVNIVGSDFNGFGVSCAGTCDAELLAIPGNAVGAISYLWSDGGNVQVVSNRCPGEYAVTVTDQLGNTAVGTYVVTGPPALITQVEVTCSSEAGAQDGSAVAVVSGGVEPFRYTWSNGSMNSSIHGITAGPYSVTIEDANGCEFSQRFDICIDGIPCYQAISVITPNDDGKNDWFMINCIYQNPNTLSIYNRYGGLEYEAIDYDNSWDGVDQEGNVLPDGGYHWVLLVDLPGGTREVYKGTVSVVRSLD